MQVTLDTSARAIDRDALCPSTSALFSAMRGRLTVTAYATRGRPKLDAFVGRLENLLREYKAAGAGKFEYAIVDASAEGTRKKARDAGLIEQPLDDAGSGEKAVVAQGYMGLVFEYGGQQDTIKFMPPDRTDGLEFWITSKIREIRDKGDDIHHKIGILYGDDEIKPSENNLVPESMGKFSMQGIITQNFSFYTFTDVDLKGGDAEIPDDLEGLIITQPGKDLNEKELRRIDRFVMKGKALAVFVSAVNVEANDATMKATLSTHGLDKLLEAYGVGINKDVVIDAGRHARLVVQTSAGPAAVELPQVLEVAEDRHFTADKQLLDTSFPCLFRNEDVVVPFASSLALEQGRQPGAKVRALMRSSPAAVQLMGETVDLRPFQKWAPRLEGLQQQQFVLAASVKGTLRSAFPKDDRQGVDAPAESTKPSRIFVLSSSQLFANPLARAGAAPATSAPGATTPNQGGDEQLLALAGPYAQQFVTSSILVFKDTLDWLILDDVSASCFGPE